MSLFDVALMPLALMEDIIDPYPMLMEGEESYTRRQIRKIEEDL